MRHSIRNRLLTIFICPFVVRSPFLTMELVQVQSTYIQVGKKVSDIEKMKRAGGTL